MTYILDKSNCPEAEFGGWDVCDETCPYYGCINHPFEDPYVNMFNALYVELKSMGYNRSPHYESIVPEYIFNQICLFTYVKKNIR